MVGQVVCSALSYCATRNLAGNRQSLTLPLPPTSLLTNVYPFAKAARQLQMDIVPEAGMHYYWDLTMLIDGHTTIEHCIPMAPLFNDVVLFRFWKKSLHCFCIPKTNHTHRLPSTPRAEPPTLPPWSSVSRVCGVKTIGIR